MRPWPQPFADSHDGRLTRRQWLWLGATFAALHYLSLVLALGSGNYDPQPNHDHVRVMDDVLATGLPQRAIWPPAFGYYITGKWLLTRALGVPYAWGKWLVDVWVLLAAGVMATRLGQVLTRNRLMAVASGLGLVAAPLFLLASAEGLAVLLFQPFFLASLELLARALQAPGGSFRLTAASGALMGVACLVRANPQFLVLALVPVVFWSVRRRCETRRVPWRVGLRTVALVAVFFLAQSLVTAPWQLYQRRLGESGVFTAPVFFYAFVDGLARHPGNRVSDWVRANRGRLPLDFGTFVEINTRWLREDPMALARLYALKAVRTWYLSDSGRWDRAIVAFHFPWWLGALFGLGTWWRRRRDDPALWFVVLVLGYLWGVSALVSGLARYLAPAYGFLALLTAGIRAPRRARARAVS